MNDLTYEIDLTDNTTPEIESKFINHTVPATQSAKDMEMSFFARNPNAYGVYGATKEVIKASLPYIKYIDPEEREKFMKLSQQQQTRELLFETLNAVVLGRWKPISGFATEVGGAALEAFLPKTAKILTQELPSVGKYLSNKRGVIGSKKPADVPSAQTVTETQGADPAVVDETWAKVQKLSSEWGSTIEKQRRGTRSHELAAEEAKTIGATLDDIKAIAPGTTMNDAQAVNLIQTIKGVATEAQSAAKTALESKTPADMDTFLNKFLALGEVDPARMGVVAESGRTLSVMNDPISGANKYLTQFSEALSRTDLTKEQLAGLVATFKSEADMAKAARLALQPGKIESIMQLWVKGLLTGPPTQAANIIGNSLYTGLQVPERVAAATLGRVLPGTAEVSFGEAGAMIKGAIAGFRDGLRLAGHSYMSEESQFAKVMGQASSSKMEISNKMTEAFGDNWFGKAMQLYDDALGYASTRPLLAGDDFFKAVSYRAELHALAIRETERLGLTGKDAAKKIEMLLNNPPESLKTDAIKFAQYTTFQEELGAAGHGVMNLVNSLPPLRFILPFVKTPANIFTGFIDRTPFAPFRKAVRNDIMEGGAKRDLALARIGLGSMLAASTGFLVMDGKITGGGPSDPVQKGIWLQNNPAFSIKVGNKWYSYARLEPIGTIIGVAASAVEILKELDAGEIDSDNITSSIVAAFSKNVTDKTFLQGITKLSNAVTDPDRFGKAYVNQLAGSVVPAASGSVARQIDPELKELQSMLDSIKSRIPGLGKDMPPKRNLWGEALVAETLGPSLISPIRAREDDASPADKELLRNKIYIEKASKYLEGGPLMTPQEYDRYVVLAGNELKSPSTGLGLKDTLNAMVNDIEYQRQSDGPDGGKALMIKQQIHAFREMAKERIKEEYPELGRAVEVWREDKQAARQPLY